MMDTSLKIESGSLSGNSSSSPGITISSGDSSLPGRDRCVGFLAGLNPISN